MLPLCIHQLYCASHCAYLHVTSTLEIDTRTRKKIIHEQNRVIRLLNAPGLVVLGHSSLHPKLEEEEKKMFSNLFRLKVTKKSKISKADPAN